MYQGQWNYLVGDNEISPVVIPFLRLCSLTELPIPVSLPLSNRSIHPSGASAFLASPAARSTLFSAYELAHAATEQSAQNSSTPGSRVCARLQHARPRSNDVSSPLYTDAPYSALRPPSVALNPCPSYFCALQAPVILLLMLLLPSGVFRAEGLLFFED